VSGTGLALSNLHLIHGWGGGLRRWTELFSRHDPRRRNLMLSSHRSRAAYGLRFYLQDGASGATVEEWTPQEPICELAISSREYAARLTEIIERHGVGRLFVSSLIGHSLDALATPLRTTIVHHDYFPFCPALNLHFDGQCTRCLASDLRRCLAHNPLSHLFRHNHPSYWERVRQEYFAVLDRPRVEHVCPSLGAAAALRQVDPRFAARRLHVIPHGDHHPRRNCFGGAGRGRRLRLLLLGELNVWKGLPRFERLLPRLCLSFDLQLVGCGVEAGEFAGVPRLTRIESYTPEELPDIFARLRPDLALFLSEVPETFSLTLSEATLHCIPPCARAVGSFAERIVPGLNGVLCGTSDGDVVETLLALDENRGLLRRIAAALELAPRRTAAQMVEDYYRLPPPDRFPLAGRPRASQGLSLAAAAGTA
jgi:hypothetical protein